MGRLSLEEGDYNLKLLNMESERLAGGGHLYFDHNCILSPISETLLFSQGPDKDSDRNENSFPSLVSANMATHSDLGMAFLLTGSQGSW